MKKVLLIIPDGTGIKNYLYADVFKDVDASLHLMHEFDDRTLATIKNRLNIGENSIIPDYQESIKERYLRELIHLLRIKFNVKKLNNPSILKFYKPKSTNLKQRLFYKAIELRSLFSSSYKSIEKLEEKYENALCKNNFYNEMKLVLKNVHPDVVFCSHQRALKMPTIFKAARDLNIHASTVIYSWDNIPKARLALRADQYLVWSSVMKKELLMLYPEIKDAAIAITGSPQFEFYKDHKNIITKDEFYTSRGLDPNKKIVCFSGDDVRTSPNDPAYLEDLADEIVTAKLQDTYQIAFRRCPVDVSGRYDTIVEKYKDLIIEMPPLWNINTQEWSAIYPREEDVSELVSLAYYADVVINVGSTMAFDFGMFNKPCIYINYDQPDSGLWSTEIIYTYQHFKSMPSADAVLWWNSKSAIVPLLQSLEKGVDTTINTWMHIINEHPQNAAITIKKALGI